MNNEHVLLCVLGRTASGKDTLVNKLCERSGLTQLISYTTRERRVNEGDTHIFATEDDYKQAKEHKQIAAFTQIGKFKYWCTIDQIYAADCYVVDYSGLQCLRELNLPGIRLVTVFINVPDDIREDRALNKRKDDRIKFRERTLSERDQFRIMLKNADFDYAISNIDFAKAFSVLKWISQAEGLWKNHMEDVAE